MSLLINPGSDVPSEPENTYQRAKETAEQWHANILDRWPEVTMTIPDPEDCTAGRWRFLFHHPVTGVTRELDVHGVAEHETGPFGLRIYWHGSSSSTPQDGSWLPHWGDPVVDYLTRSPYNDDGSHAIDSGLTTVDDVTWRAVTLFEPVCVCDRVGDGLILRCPMHSSTGDPS